jgi:hypothetical protein
MDFRPASGGQVAAEVAQADGLVDPGGRFFDRLVWEVGQAGELLIRYEDDDSGQVFRLPRPVEVCQTNRFLRVHIHSYSRWGYAKIALLFLHI